MRDRPSPPSIRRATAADLPAIIAMLADDPLGATREDARLPLDPAYLAAFAAIEADPNQFLALAETDGDVIGTLQLTMLPGLARKGAWRAQIEAVRVRGDHRAAGIGQMMFAWAIQEARARGCHLVQLTTDKSRPDAHRFYERLGFRATHEGYKLAL
jgi:GNAT superfamily N-acetyltransferase